MMPEFLNFPATFKLELGASGLIWEAASWPSGSLELQEDNGGGLSEFEQLVEEKLISLAYGTETGQGVWWWFSGLIQVGISGGLRSLEPLKHNGSERLAEGESLRVI